MPSLTPLFELNDLDAGLAAHLAAPAWYVGISGGVDSSVLLHMLANWCDAHPDSPPLHALHVNHQLQPSAAAFEAHCRNISASLHVPLRCLSVEVAQRSSPEAAAREARYTAFEQTLPAGAVLFLAHHLDDQVETVFLRLLRGAGVEGLSAMQAVRPLAVSSGEVSPETSGETRRERLVVRPLLRVPRAALEAYAQQNELTYFDDPTNADTALDRNFLRAQVLPLLETRWPGYRQTVARASGNLAATAEALRESLGMVQTVSSSMGDCGVGVHDLVDPAGADKLRMWLQTQGLQLPDQKLLREFLRQLREAAADAAPRMDVGTYQLQRFRGAVYLLPQQVSHDQAAIYELEGAEICEIPGVGRVSLQPSTAAGFSLGPGEKARVVWRSGGEQCRLVEPHSGAGKNTTLKKLLQSWHIPPWWRQRVPLIFVGSELVAVGGLALCQSSHWKAQAHGDEQLWTVLWTRDEKPLQTGSED